MTEDKETKLREVADKEYLENNKKIAFEVRDVWKRGFVYGAKWMQEQQAKVDLDLKKLWESACRAQLDAVLDHCTHDTQTNFHAIKHWVKIVPFDIQQVNALKIESNYNKDYLKIVFNAGKKCMEEHPDDDSYDDICFERVVNIQQPESDAVDFFNKLFQSEALWILELIKTKANGLAICDNAAEAIDIVKAIDIFLSEFKQSKENKDE